MSAPVSETLNRPLFARGNPEGIARGGEGCYVEDISGRHILDLTGGSQGVPLGRQTRALTEAIEWSSQGPVHLPEPFRSEAELALATDLLELSPFADRVFFCSAPGEAIDYAIRFARMGRPRSERDVVSFHGSCHGGTYGALAASGDPSADRRYGPLPRGYRTLPWADADALRAIHRSTCAVLLEPIQGQAGVRVAPPRWLEALRARCTETGALLVFDETACGIAHSGRMWTHDRLGVAPDLLCTGNLAAGLPFHAVLLPEGVARVYEDTPDQLPPPAASPFMARLALTVLKKVSQPVFLRDVARRGRWLREELLRLQAPSPLAIRGLGLHVGIQSMAASRDVAAAALENGLVVNPVHDRVVQLLPSLTVTHEELSHAIELLQGALDDAH